MTSPKHQKTRRHVLVLTSTFPRWRNDKEPPFVYELCKRLQGTMDCTVLAPHFPGARNDEKMDGIRIRRFRYFLEKRQTLTYEGGILARLKQNRLRYLLIPFFIFSELLATIRQLRTDSIDAIHAHWLIPQGLVAVLACKLSGKKIPILCTVHGGDLYSLQGRLLTKIKKYVLRNLNGISAVSNAMVADLEKLHTSRGRIKVIPMGVDLSDTFTPNQNIIPEKHSLLFVGRLVEKKGISFLIHAIPLLLNQFPDCKLTIAGSGPEESDLRQIMTDLKLEKHIHFIGNIENRQLPDLYNRHEILVFPSIVASGGDREGFGLVIVEALGCERPVISTNLPAMQDIISNEINAIIVKEKDSAEIAQAVEKLFQNPAYAKQLATRGRQDVTQKYDWAHISEKYTVFLKDITVSK